MIASATLLAFPFAQYAQEPAQNPPPPAPSQAPQTAPQQQPTFVREVNLVDVLLTVLDRRNKLVPDLEKSDFKIGDTVTITATVTRSDTDPAFSFGKRPTAASIVERAA